MDQNNNKKPVNPTKQIQQQRQKLAEHLINQLKLQKQKNQRVLKQQQQNLKKIYSKKGNQLYIVENQDQQVPVDGDIMLGSRVYMSKCYQCHSLQPSSTDNKIGPAIGLIYNRKAGTDTNYHSYSKQLIHSNFFWSAKNLYNFMYKPQTIIQFTKCKLFTQSIPQQSDRADLIMFLKEYSLELNKNMIIRAVQLKGYDYYQSQLYSQIEANKYSKRTVEQQP